MGKPTQDLRVAVNVAVPAALGDAVISTGVLRWLLEGETPSLPVTAWTRHPWVLSAFSEARNLRVRRDVENAPGNAIDLSGYLLSLPHRSVAPKHHMLSMLDVLAAKVPVLRSRRKRFVPPLLQSTPAEARSAGDALASILEGAEGKALVWLCGRSTTRNRNPGSAFWIEVAEAMRDRACVIEFLAPQEEPTPSDLIQGLRLAPGAAACAMGSCQAGVAVDTFGLHLAAAAGFDRVAVVLGSSAPACVCYPGNVPVYAVSDRTHACQPCGNHGYADEEAILKTMPGLRKRFRPDNRCLFPDVPCLRSIGPGDVVEALDQWLRPGRAGSPARSLTSAGELLKKESAWESPGTPARRC